MHSWDPNISILGLRWSPSPICHHKYDWLCVNWSQNPYVLDKFLLRQYNGCDMPLRENLSTLIINNTSDLPGKMRDESIHSLIPRWKRCRCIICRLDLTSPPQPTRRRPPAKDHNQGPWEYMCFGGWRQWRANTFAPRTRTKLIACFQCSLPGTTTIPRTGESMERKLGDTCLVNRDLTPGCAPVIDEWCSFNNAHVALRPFTRILVEKPVDISL